jgi:hypothetical protein
MVKLYKQLKRENENRKGPQCKKKSQETWSRKCGVEREGDTGNDGEFSWVPPSRRIPVLGSNPTLLHPHPSNPLLHHPHTPRMSFRPMLKQVCSIADS